MRIIRTAIFGFAQKIPTWLVVTLTVLLLSFLTIWFHDDIRIKSLQDLFTRQALKVLFENAESIAIVAAVVLYFKEAPDRKEQKHYEAWQVIDNAAAANVPTSYARFKALQDLNKDGVSLKGVDVPCADLEGINLADADLKFADLSSAILTHADLKFADLSSAILTHADLSSAILTHADLFKCDLSHADLAFADLSHAYLGHANLRYANLGFANLSYANLSGANLSDAYLTGINFSNADLSDANFSGADLSGANLKNANLNSEMRTVFGQASTPTVEQIKASKNWESAHYDKDFRQALGLPRKHEDL